MTQPAATPDNKSHHRMEAMFNSIAAAYDIVNKLSSFGLDGYWRRRLVRCLRETNAEQVLDIACGTGVLSRLIYRKLRLEVTGLDLSPQMLQVARIKMSAKAKRQSGCAHCKEPQFIEGVAEELPFSDQSFDAVTIAFGVRNFENRRNAFEQIYRVLRLDGHLLILEFATPKNRIWYLFFNCYFRHILPFVGRIISGNKSAYRYLPQSVVHFPQYQELCKELADAGFSAVTCHAYTGGVAVLYRGIRTSDKM